MMLPFPIHHLICTLLLCAAVLEGSAQNTDAPFTYPRDGGGTGRIALIKYTDSLYVLRHSAGDSLLSEWRLPYPVYRFDCGDITGNGLPEIAVGVVKPTRHFPTPDRRLFLFKLYKGLHIRPLWLGSRLGLPLVDFRIEPGPAPRRIRATGRKSDGSTAIALYRYTGFGPMFERYIHP